MKSDDWNRRYAETERLWSATPNQFVASELAELEPGRALDLAAGEGRNAVWLAARGWHVRAIDFAEVAIERGRQGAAEHGVDVDWQVADLTDADLGERAWDLVLVSYLHLPWDQLQPILDRAIAAVAPGGTFFLIGHDRRNLADGYGGPPSEAVLYGPDDITGLLDGLTVERAETVDRKVATADGPRTALDVLVHAVRPAEESA
jgi:2-polyprenyl-3-methyl-5-hydroxy-6-metoxy-1,4-benzoquinol methylase